ncbi:helix-turn-helix transcriptional regulator [Halopseudomonas salegens]|uniref:Predicted DNA-binding transcriptional regulator YafY, contains an HTH and WYL domains n=1 Tax=Halopseudomonas salegens TaxID=1434072 RepID=A0A1H2F4C8_9GAMM|nr:YafY family protein [Halopseudomonas salegens]SDU01798.1 Predicted DNA-binding transcriptional regulator YafY, contains an HTH and WYL domains [Halopseudomonas salegens]
MTRTTRLFDLMQILRRHRRAVSGDVLAGELGVSLRTLYRDIAELKAIGAHIQGEPGLGYLLQPDFLLPPLMFSADEVAALTLGLNWVEERADEQLASAATEVLAKVSAVLPRELCARLNDQTMLIGPGWDKAHRVALSELRQAISEERKLLLDYRDEAGRTSNRVIWPISLVFFESARILAGWCELRQAFRHFRTDRIAEATILAEHYPQRRHALRQQWLTTLDETNC